MTELLGQLLAQLSLPMMSKDAIAARLSPLVQDEQTWKTQFESTTIRQWDRIAEIVREIAAGRYHTTRRL